MKKRLLLLVILTSLLLAACGDEADEAGALIPVTACYSGTSGAQTASWYALEKGLFEKYGLDVELLFVDGGSQAAASLIAGEIDICQIAGSAVVNAVAAGEDLTLIGGLTNTYVYSLMALPVIESAEDLRGKAIAVSDPGASSDAAARAALAGLGLDPDSDVTIVSVGGNSARLAAMETGQVAATVVSIPNTVEARERGFVEILNMSDLGTPYQHTGIAARRSFIEENREVAVSFMKAITEGIALMKQDREGTMEVMAQYLLLDVEEDAPTLTEGYDLIILGYMPRVPYPTLDGVQTLLTALETDNPAAADYTPADATDLSIVEELESSGFIDALYE